MNILFLTLVYPEGQGSRGIYVDLIQELIKKGNKVTVVTPVERKSKKDTNITMQDGVKVLRVKTLNIQKTNIIEKGISTLSIESLFKSAIKKKLSDEKYDLVLYSTPPITFAKVISFIKKRDNAKSYLLLKDIFPQNAVDLNMMKKNGLIYKVFRNKEKKLYEISDYIGCMSQANVDFILKHNVGIDEKKVEVLPNSIIPNVYDKLSDSEVNIIREKYGLPDDKTIFVYGGNLGKPQGIEFLIEVLKSNRYNRDVFFLICGSGTEFDSISENILKEELENVKLYSYIPKVEYDNLLRACHVGLIFLDKRFTIPNFPSRLLSYMDLSMPIIAATDINTDIGKVIESGNMGYWCESGKVERFNSIIDMYIRNKDLIRNHGKNARKYLKKNYTAKGAAEDILKHFR